MRFGIVSRPALGQIVNGDSCFVYEWDEKTVLAVFDGLGHGAGANEASEKAKQCLIDNCQYDLDKVILNIHTCLHDTRGAAAAVVKIDRKEHCLSSCAVGNVDVRILAEPPMHPAPTDGILGLNLRKPLKFEYKYSGLTAVMLHSDGISDRFNVTDYISFQTEPQQTAEKIMKEWGKEHDDATIILAIDDNGNRAVPAENSASKDLEIIDDLHALIAAESARKLATSLGFSEADSAKVAIATSELAHNISRHARGKGRITLTPISKPRVGLMVVSKDEGSGIPNPGKALEGQSTGGGLGIGLGAVKRLMDEFTLETVPGKGTTIVAKKFRP